MSTYFPVLFAVRTTIVMQGIDDGDNAMTRCWQQQQQPVAVEDIQTARRQR